LSIDKEAIIDDVVGGGAVARQLVGPASIGYNSNLEAYPYDMAKAKQPLSPRRRRTAFRLMCR
jgi:ABC-type transport system substrate-binding protein